jgi:predicted nucleotidyltransferase
MGIPVSGIFIPLIGIINPLFGMLASFLLTPKQQRILAALLLHPDVEYTFAELKECAGGGVSSLQDYLGTLTGAGVVSVRQDRASKKYRANTEHPLYPELRGIAVKSFAVVEPIRDALRPLSNLIAQAFVFGSIAKSTEKHDSDVDLMVVGKASAGKLRAALASAEQLIGREIHINSYGVDEWSELVNSDPVIKSIAEGSRIELHVR